MVKYLLNKIKIAQGCWYLFELYAKNRLLFNIDNQLDYNYPQILKQKYTIRNNMINLCRIHNKPIHYICTELKCSGKRIVCHECRSIQHAIHSCVAVGDIDDSIRQFGQSYDNLGDKDSGGFEQIEKNLDVIFKNFNVLHKVCSDFNNLQFDLPKKVVKKLYYFFISCKDTLKKYFEQLGEHQKMQQSQNIAQIYRFLKSSRAKEQINSHDKLCYMFQAINAKIQRSIYKWRTTVQNASTLLYTEMVRYGEVGNWLDIMHEYGGAEQPTYINRILKSQEGIVKRTRNFPYQQFQVSVQNNNKRNRFKYSDLDNIGLDSQLQDKIEQMFNQVFQNNSTTIAAGQKQYSSQQQWHELIPRIKTEQSTTNISINPNISINMKQLQTASISNTSNKQNKLNKQNQYMRFVTSCPKIDKPILKSKILDIIAKLAANQNYVSQLKEFVIEGPNQFDLECLKVLSKSFPGLVKFNYIWDFQQNGLRLQKQQVFFQKTHSMQKNIKDLKMSQQLLNTYGMFPELQNLAITQIQQFAFNQMRIMNKNIRHLTLGQYVQSWQDELLPNCLKKQALGFSGLITLNIFNIKKIDGNFMERIIKQNTESLKNVWLSQCIELEDSFLVALGNSKIQNIIFQQIKNIRSTIYIPQSTKSLILQNCQIQNQVPLSGLSKAINIRNFSIYLVESQFCGAENMGDTLIQILSEIEPSNIRYLNVGECRSVTDRSLKYLEKMPKLRQICIDNTEIRLVNLLKAEGCLKKLKKLGIVGLQIDQPRSITSQPCPKIEKTLQKLLQKSTNLETISLKFTDELSSIPKDAFKNLKHISLLASTNKKQYKKKNLKDMVEMLKQIKKSVNIV